jgi:cytochrome P450
VLGLPLDEWKKYAEPMHTNIYAVPGTPLHDEAIEGLTWVIQRLYGLVAERRSKPEDDLLSELVAARIDGQPLSDDDIVNIAFLIIAGGFDTTTSMIANVLLYLHHNHDARTQLRENPDQIPTAIEEFLRYFTPTQALARTVTRDTELGGQNLRAGDRVLMCWAGANHDPAVFENPDDIVLDRFPNRHTTFGLGIHRCLGSNFARAELALMLEEVLRRLPDWEINEDEAERYQTIGVVNGWIKMPATFTPGQRIGNGSIPG